MSTAKLVVWLHWQATWVRFRDSSSQPLADHPPVPPMLQRKGGCERTPSTRGSPRLWCPRGSPCGIPKTSATVSRYEDNSPGDRVDTLPSLSWLGSALKQALKFTVPVPSRSKT